MHTQNGRISADLKKRSGAVLGLTSFRLPQKPEAAYVVGPVHKREQPLSPRARAQRAEGPGAFWIFPTLYVRGC